MKARGKKDREAERLHEMYEATIRGYLRSVETHVVDCDFRDFARWALESHHEPRERFAQINAISQLARMTTLLLSPVADEETWARCVRAASVMNAWQIHEVFSDNLAIGLGMPPGQDGPEQRSRRILLRAFNEQMLRAFARTDDSSPAHIAAQLTSLAHGISIFEQSLIADKHQQLAAAFARNDPRVMQAVEGCIVPILAANVVSCLDVPRNIRNETIRSITVEWLAHRYASVNVLLDAPEVSHQDLVEHGTRTILVVPTLAYYIDLFVPQWFSCDIVMEVLAPALRAAATIVRLQNDLGTLLLTADPADRHRLLQSLLDERRCVGTLRETLAAQRHVMLTRLVKDARFAEFNVVLHGLLHVPLETETLEVLAARIDDCAEDYRRSWQALDALSDTLDRVTGSTRCRQVIVGFARFHEELYSHQHEASQGEYAI